MSLLGEHEPVTEWVPVEVGRTPARDEAALSSALRVAATLLRSPTRYREMGVELGDAQKWLRLRLEEGRREAAEVRFALGLPMTATLGDVLTAIRARGA